MSVNNNYYFDMIVHISLIIFSLIIFIITIHQIFMSLKIEIIQKRQKKMFMYHLWIFICSLFILIQILILTLIKYNKYNKKKEKRLYLFIRILRWIIMFLGSFLYFKFVMFGIIGLNKSNLSATNNKITNINKYIIKLLFSLNTFILFLCILSAIYTKSALSLNYYDIFFSCLIIFASLFVGIAIILKIRIKLQNIIIIKIRSIYLSKILLSNEIIINEKKQQINQLKKARKKLDIIFSFLFAQIIFQIISLNNHFNTDWNISIYTSPFLNRNILINQFLFMLCWLSALIAHTFIYNNNNNNNNNNDIQTQLAKHIKDTKSNAFDGRRKKEEEALPELRLYVDDDNNNKFISRQKSTTKSKTRLDIKTPIGCSDNKQYSFQESPEISAIENNNNNNLKINVLNLNPKSVSFPSPTVSARKIKKVSDVTPVPRISDFGLMHISALDNRIKFKNNIIDYKDIDVRKYPDHVGCHARKLTKQQKKYREKYWKFHHHGKEKFDIIKLLPGNDEIQLHNHHSSPTGTDKEEEEEEEEFNDITFVDIIMNDILNTIDIDNKDNNNDNTLDGSIHLKLADDITGEINENKNKMRKYPDYYYNEKNEKVVNKLSENCKIRLIIFEFEEVLCTFSNRYFNATVPTINLMNDKSIKMSFGGEKRIEYIDKLFINIQQKQKQKKQKISILCVSPNSYSPVLFEIFQRLNMIKYFNNSNANFLGYDHQLMKQNENKIYLVILKLIYSFKLKHENILYIGHDKQIISHLKNISICNTYSVKTDGITYNDTQRIQTAFF